jgi:hypothetical protein
MSDNTTFIDFGPIRGLVFSRDELADIIACDMGRPATEYETRIIVLMANRRMTVRAARIVVDAAMYGIGCTEGRVRAEIEAHKKKPIS